MDLGMASTFVRIVDPVVENPEHVSNRASENEVMLINYNYQYDSIGSRISDEDYQHEVIKRTCERVGVKYERELKT